MHVLFDSHPMDQDEMELDLVYKEDRPWTYVYTLTLNDS